MFQSCSLRALKEPCSGQATSSPLPVRGARGCSACCLSLGLYVLSQSPAVLPEGAGELWQAVVHAGSGNTGLIVAVQ